MMKAYKNLRSGYWLGLVAGLLTAGTASAQNTYLYNNDASASTTVAGTYTDLGTNGTAIVTSNNDDDNSAAQNIGFNFVYGGTTFTQFVLNTNGLIRLGANAPSYPDAASPYGQDPTGSLFDSPDPADANLLAPFNFDLGPGTGTPEFRVYTSGTAGSRVCTIQWKNMSDKNTDTNQQTATVLVSQIANFSFQVKLYEGSNQIEFVYGPSTAGGASALKQAVVGIKGATYNIGKTVLAIKASSNAWSTATFTTGPQSLYTNAFNFRSVALPDVGRTIRFTNTATCVNAAITTFPYSENFDSPVTAALPCGATGLDANNDVYTWLKYADNGTNVFSSSAPYSLFIVSGGADDWYFTPALRMRAGYSYQLQFKYRGFASTTQYVDALEVKAGTSATPSGQNISIFSNNNISGNSYTTTGKTTDIRPAVDANYYIGFHSISGSNGGITAVDDIVVTETRILGVKNGTNTLFSAEASPVPFSTSLTLSLNTVQGGDLHLTMRDVLGRTLRQTTVKAVAGSNSIAVPEVASLPAGIYFLDVEQAGQKQVLRVTHE